MDGYLYAVNPTGTQKSRFYTGGHCAQSSPAIGADGTIYMGSYNGGIVYALNPDGQVKWSFQAEAAWGSVVNFAIGSDRTIYFGGVGSNKFYALNPDGTLRWVYNGPSAHHAPVIANDGTIYFLYYFGGLYALDSDGNLKWSFPTYGPQQGAPALGTDGTIYIGSYEGKIYAKLTNIVDEFAEKYPGDVSVASFTLWLYNRSPRSKEEFNAQNNTITLTFKMEDE